MSATNKSPKEGVPDPPRRGANNALKFVFGGLSGMGATCVVQPLDLVKTRMQISGSGSGAKEYRNTFHCIQTVIGKEGALALYTGIGAALLRQATYTTGRLGVYTYLNEKYRDYNQNIFARMGMGMTAGACGAFMGTPAEVALIRMTADGRLPIAERRNYTSVVNALSRIVSEEGVAALWRGCIPTIGRAMVVNMAQLGTYSQVKSYLMTELKMPEGLGLQFCSSMVSGFITTFVSLPVDITKTRIQNMKVAAGVQPEYRGTIDALYKISKREGVTALWKGFTPYYARLGPHTVLTFILLEQINILYSVYVLGEAGGSSGL